MTKIYNVPELQMLYRGWEKRLSRNITSSSTVSKLAGSVAVAALKQHLLHVA